MRSVRHGGNEDMAGGTKGAERTQGTRVFISYSRRNKDFAESLRDQLVARGFEAYLDQHDILPGEPWRERLAGLIAAADTVVFCLSPDFVASKICDWEVNEAERLGKRLLPVVAIDTPDDDVPQRLKRLNYIFMRGPSESAERMEALVAALDTDIDWVRSHTRLGQLAAEWDQGKRSTELVLRGAALLAAEQWISAPPAKGPSPTNLQRDFILAGRAEALAHAVRIGRIQVLIGLLAAAVLVGIGYFGWANRASIEFEARLLLDDVTPAFVSVLSRSAEKTMRAGESFKECASCPEMTVVPAGQFLMGSAAADGPGSERPQHEVAIARPFAVSRFLITFAQWDACRAHNGCSHRPDDRGWGRALIPVTDISWSDAKRYVEWLSKQTGRPYRLLSEAEWEYAARAGSRTKYPWGNEIGQGANCPDSETQWADKQPSPVGTFAPNAFGLYDMIGNLWEWVEDNWHPDYAGAPRDGSVWQGGDADQRVLRGGSYAVTAGECSSSFRDFARPPDFRNYIFGIRVARSLAAAE